jgi:hypothetical protein
MEAPDRIAGAMSDTEFAKKMCAAKGEGVTCLQNRVALSATNADAGITETTERRGKGGGPPRLLLLPLFKPKRPKQERNRPLRGLRFRICFRITLHWKRYLVSGSSDDWKMLICAR